MTDVAQQSSPVRATARAVRHVIGFALIGAAALSAGLFILGSSNLTELVALKYRFGNPMLGLLVVPLVALLGLMLALPVRNEARQRGRITSRWLMVVLAVAGGFGWGIFGDHFTFEAEELARSDDGRYAVAMVTDRDVPPRSSLRVWVGSGLTAREVGDLGGVCGLPGASFVAEHRIALTTPYGQWSIDLDPATGAPRQVLGPGCSDGPVAVGDG